MYSTWVIDARYVNYLKTLFIIFDEIAKKHAYAIYITCHSPHRNSKISRNFDLEIVISPIDQRKRKKVFIVRSTDVISLSERKRYPSIAKYLPRDLFRLLQSIGCSSLALVKQVNGRLGCR